MTTHADAPEHHALPAAAGDAAATFLNAFSDDFQTAFGSHFIVCCFHDVLFFLRCK
jgi:hypothetical protein